MNLDLSGHFNAPGWARIVLCVADELHVHVFKYVPHKLWRYFSGPNNFWLVSMIIVKM